VIQTYGSEESGDGDLLLCSCHLCGNFVFIGISSERSEVETLQLLKAKLEWLAHRRTQHLRDFMLLTKLEMIT
jgi:hypothetical protein